MIRFGIKRGAAAALVLCSAHAVAQSYDPDALLRRAIAAMGADNLSTLKFSAAGSGGGIGQPYTAGKAWPKQNLSFTRSIDYASVSLQDEVARSRSEPRGGTAVPLSGEQKLTEAVSGGFAWTAVGTNVRPGNNAVTERSAQVWLSPHGALKAAQKGKTTLAFRDVGAKRLAAVSFTEPGVISATAFINDEYLVERIEALVPNQVLGDMPVVTTFSEYREFGKVKFPTRIEESQGGYLVMQLVVTDVQPNAKVEIAVPDAVKNARETVTAQKLSPSVWFFAGGSHNSVAVEMKDHIVVIEGPLSDERAGPVIAEVKKQIPGKPIRFVVNTHMHFDHSGGLGAFVAEGATIVTHQSNKAYLQRAFGNARAIKPDLLARSKRKPEFRTVDHMLAIGDREQPIELHHVKGNDHSDGLLVAWLPKDKLLVQADLFAPLPPNATPGKPSPVLANFAENLQRLKLVPDRIVGIHGGVAPGAELKRAMGQ